MESATITAREGRLLASQSGAAESAASAVSWPAIIAGAFAMASVSLILLALGSGLGLASVSPWYNSGPSPTTFGVWAAVWLIVVQWLSAVLGGYLTGRLRTKWVAVHTDEVYFRDTAHGFLAWAVAAVIMAAALSSGISSAVGSVARATGSLASAAAQGAGTAAVQSGGVDPTGYLVDTLFAPTTPTQMPIRRRFALKPLKSSFRGCVMAMFRLRTRPTCPSSLPRAPGSARPMRKSGSMT